MGFYAQASIVIVLVSGALVLLIRRNLRQRPMARRFRATFIKLADELVPDPDFPDAHAKALTYAARIPEGWLTRFMVLNLFREMLFGRPAKSVERLPLKNVPEHLQIKYVAALFALALSDSYRCALLGRIWRGANLWILDAVKEPEPDVKAHATKRVIEQVSVVPQSERLRMK